MAHENESLRRVFDSVQESIRLYSRHSGDTPETMGWEAFATQNPGYIDVYYGAALILAKGGRSELEGLEQHANLGGALIRRHLTNEQITQYGR